MRLLVPLLALALAGCTVTVHRLGPVGSSLGQGYASGDPGADAGSLLLQTQRERDTVLDAYTMDRFIDPSIGMDLLVGPQLDPTLLDPTLLDPRMRSESSPGPVISGGPIMGGGEMGGGGMGGMAF